ncbi:Protein TRANSPARENT TESTA 12 [Glycine soja]|nr:Protein TRANSPARENT TESTA 12 [Glycine soja]
MPHPRPLHLHPPRRVLHHRRHPLLRRPPPSPAPSSSPSPSLGMVSALETLCGQAYCAGHHRMLGVYLQRSRVVPVFHSDVAGVHFCHARVEVNRETYCGGGTGGFSGALVDPFHLSSPFQFTLQRFLQCQLKTDIIAWVSRIRNGIVGTALSIGFSWWLSVLGMLGYPLFGGCPRSWTGFSAEAFIGLWEFFKPSLASGVMLALVFFLPL